MLLGKRPRPPIKRTTSMTAITVDFTGVEPRTTAPANHRNAVLAGGGGGGGREEDEDEDVLAMGPGNACDQRLLAMVSPRNPRRSLSTPPRFWEPAHFLRTCGFCSRPLAPARDIYIYRGDTAFCSVECREQRMKQEEGKEAGVCAAVAIVDPK